MRLALLFGSLTLAFLLAVWTTQVPRPRPLDAPAAAFSAAMRSFSSFSMRCASRRAARVSGVSRLMRPIAPLR